jgi:hypothetical protein
MWGSEGIAPPLLTSALDGGEWLATPLAALPPWKEPPVPVALY